MVSKRDLGKGRVSLHTSQVAHQAGAYPGFCRMNRLRVFLLPPEWDASLLQGYLPALNSTVHFYTPGWREALRVKHFPQKHNTIYLARA